MRLVNPDALMSGDLDRLFLTVEHNPNVEVTREHIEQLVGYAFREVLAGEEIMVGYARRDTDTLTSFLVEYDATKSRRDDPDFVLAFETAEQYLMEGTPIRKTDRAGKGTKHTRKFISPGGVLGLSVTILDADPDDPTLPLSIVDPAAEAFAAYTTAREVWVAAKIAADAADAALRTAQEALMNARANVASAIDLD